MIEKTREGGETLFVSGYEIDRWFWCCVKGTYWYNSVGKRSMMGIYNILDTEWKYRCHNNTSIRVRALWHDLIVYRDHDSRRVCVGSGFSTFFDSLIHFCAWVPTQKPWSTSRITIRIYTQNNWTNPHVIQLQIGSLETTVCIFCQRLTLTLS